MRVIQNERTACFQDIFALPLEFLSHRLMLNEQNGEVVEKKRLRITRTLHLKWIITLQLPSAT